jgi:hypothetical protein
MSTRVRVQPYLAAYHDLYGVAAVAEPERQRELDAAVLDVG